MGDQSHGAKPSVRRSSSARAELLGLHAGSSRPVRSSGLFDTQVSPKQESSEAPPCSKLRLCDQRWMWEKHAARY